eukprot:GHUV01014213.1.p1 GENE.GHUV01014213.1~~GHUV01014213.1.p1  ORF type:complete len:425 (+),score=77.79 GHUV01014213.1:58-1332(+)
MRQRVLVRLDGAIQECTSSPGLVAHLKRCAMTAAHRHTNDASKLSYMDGADSRTGLVQDRDLPWWKQETVLQVAVALLYAVVATSMSIINRLALLVFPLPTVLLLLQMTATVAILYPLLWARVLTFKPWSFSRFQQLLGISFFYTANTAFALFGLRGMNLPMYTAVKRLTPMVILVTKSVWKKKWPAPRLTASVMLVVLGCIIAGAGDLSFDMWAYSYAFCSVITQSIYLLLVEFQADVAGSSTNELLWYNAITSLPLLTAITAVNGDFHKIQSALATGITSHSAFYVYFMIAATATMGCLLNYSMFLCARHTSALTTTIVGVLRGVVTVLLGFLVDSIKFHVLNILGLTMNTAGGVWYTWLKYVEKYGAGVKGEGGVVGKAVGGKLTLEYTRVDTTDWDRHYSQNKEVQREQQQQHKNGHENC